jgi:hypothetical protein
MQDQSISTHALVCMHVLLVAKAALIDDGESSADLLLLLHQRHSNASRGHCQMHGGSSSGEARRNGNSGSLQMVMMLSCVAPRGGDSSRCRRACVTR